MKNKASAMYPQIKRIMDIFSAIFLAILFFPIWFLVPLIIWFDSRGPIFYKHQRIGQHGHKFWLYKFRTMVEDADEVLYQKDKQLLKQFKKNDWKLQHDPRITKLGRLLRNLTIDEFPQLWNVLKGDMSLVGPRAYIDRELKSQTKKYPQTKKWIKEILQVKPGITGPWQTSGRNIIPFDKRCQIDLNYARHFNLLWDILIILKTPMAMLSKW